MSQETIICVISCVFLVVITLIIPTVLAFMDEWNISIKKKIAAKNMETYKKKYPDLLDAIYLRKKLAEEIQDHNHELSALQYEIRDLYEDLYSPREDINVTISNKRNEWKNIKNKIDELEEMKAVALDREYELLSKYGFSDNAAIRYAQFDDKNHDN